MVRIYGSNIPLARRRLEGLMLRLQLEGMDELALEIARDILPLMHRKMLAKRKPISSEPVDEHMRKVVRAYAKTPKGREQTQAQIAQKFNIHPGRVSEILKGG